MYMICLRQQQTQCQGWDKSKEAYLWKNDKIFFFFLHKFAIKLSQPSKGTFEQINFSVVLGTNSATSLL